MIIIAILPASQGRGESPVKKSTEDTAVSPEG